MSTTCARCGRNEGCGPGLCEAACENEPGDIRGEGTIACRDRELSNLHAQLRSVTRKVEMALEGVSVPEFNEDIDRDHVKELLIQVLEALA